MISSDSQHYVEAEEEFNGKIHRREQAFDILDSIKVRREAADEEKRSNELHQTRKQVTVDSRNTCDSRVMQGHAPDLKGESEHNSGAPTKGSPYQAFNGKRHVCHEVGRKTVAASNLEQGRNGW